MPETFSPFSNRPEAGRVLAQRLGRYAGRADVLVMGLPRGGVPVAFEVARALHAPLDAFVVRKLGVPYREELAMGAIARGGVRVLNRAVIESLQIPDWAIDEVATREESELERRERAYRAGRPAADVSGRTIILIDDGIATGSSVRAAVEALRRMNAGAIVVATPVAALDTAGELRREVDGFEAVATPADFGGVGLWYEDFSQTTDKEVCELLAKGAELAGRPGT